MTFLSTSVQVQMYLRRFVYYGLLMYLWTSWKLDNRSKMQLVYSETSSFILAVYLPGKLFRVNGLHRPKLSYSRGAHGISQKLVSEHFGNTSFYSKRMDNWYFADPVSIAQQQRLSSLIAAEPGTTRAVTANFPSSHSLLPQASSPQARTVNFPWIDNTVMLRPPSSLQMSMPFQQSSLKQLASKETRFTEEETKLLLAI